MTSVTRSYDICHLTEYLCCGKLMNDRGSMNEDNFPKFCPLIGGKCLEEECAWYLYDQDADGCAVLVLARFVKQNQQNQEVL